MKKMSKDVVYRVEISGHWDVKNMDTCLLNNSTLSEKVEIVNPGLPTEVRV